MSRIEDLIERGRTAPETLSPLEVFANGVTVLNNLLAQETTQDPAAIDTAIGATSHSLQEIRTDPQYSERQRRTVGLMALGRVDFRKIGERPGFLGLFNETMMTTAAGFRTSLHQERDKAMQRFIRGNIELGATVTLGTGQKNMSPIEQVDYLLEGAKTRHDAEQRRSMAVTWAQHLSEPDSKLHPNAEGLANEEYLGLLDYFRGKGDIKAVKTLAVDGNDEHFGIALKHLQQVDREAFIEVILSKLEAEARKRSTLEE